MNGGLPEIRLLALSRTQIARAAALEICRDARPFLPDLSALTVIVPSVQAAGALSRELAAAAGGPVLLPRITTFPDLSGSVPLPPAAVSDRSRELTLFAALRSQGTLEAAALWRAASELRRLGDELAAYRCRLADTPEAFTQQVERAYGRALGAPLGLEARIVYEAWKQLAGTEDSGFRYQQGLLHAASKARGALWIVACGALRPVERECLDAWAARHPVVVAEPDAPPANGFEAFLQAAFSSEDEAPLRTRADRHVQAHPRQTFRDRLALCGAPTLEAHAETAELRVRAWLAEGRKRIGVVALDRLVARRLRARLERSGILVQDESGWALSTVAAATVVARWIDCVSGRFRHRDLVDLLTAPAVFSDWESDRRGRCMARLELLLRRHGIAEGLEPLAAVASREPEADDMLAAIDRLLRAARLLEGPRASAAVWVTRLLAALAELGVVTALEADVAGRQVLDHLRALVRDVAADRTPLTLAEWREWLDAGLESALFRDRDIRSPVVLTHLGATRLRDFDALLLLGAQASSLPPAGEPGLFFNDAVRRELGLPASADTRARLLDDLLLLLAGTPQTCVTWQSRDAGEPVPLAPWLELVDAFHSAACGDSLRDDRWMAWAQTARLRSPDVAPMPPVARQPAPVLAERTPDRVSVSAYRSLVGCPYQYFAGQALALRPLDEVQEDLDKRDYGELLHRVLLRFHQRVPVVSALAPDDARREMERVTGEVFEAETDRDPLARAWAMRWRRRIGSYLELMRSREEAGWHWSAGEVPAERRVPLADGTGVTLHGRLDRLDRKEIEGGEVFGVLDYKTQKSDRLRKLLAERDDVQLACYALLHEGVVETSFVAADDEPVRVVPADRAAPESGHAEARRLSETFSAMRAGAGLAALGDEVACGYCEMGGLCRRQHWEGP